MTKNRFRRLKFKVILKTILVLIITFCIAVFVLYFLVDGAFQAPFADFFVVFCRKILGMSDSSAIQTYHIILRQNKAFWVFGGIGLLMIWGFYFAMSQIDKYLNQVSNSIDKVFFQTSETIKLSTELQPIEQQLNAIKNMLIERESTAKEAIQRKNDLVVYLAHDLKTPLTSVIGYLSLLDSAQDLPAELRKKYTSLTLDKAERLEDLIDEFFEITRFNIGEVSLEKTTINLSLMLNQLIDEFYPMLGEKSLTCNPKIEPDIIITADGCKLARVFNNLLRNAINYSYDNTDIEIVLTVSALGSTVTFKNRGNEIPSQKLGNIFKKFYRLDNSRSSKTGGSGLGLAISKEIVEFHGGTITAKSDDEWTEFSVFLPMAM